MIGKDSGVEKRFGWIEFGRKEIVKARVGYRDSVGRRSVV